jgi:geranylgeranyl pyrophosphate synthase
MDSVVFFENFKRDDVLSNLLSAFQKEMQSVDQTIRNKIVSDVATVPDIGNHIFRSGGKRLRHASNSRLCTTYRLFRQKPYNPRRLLLN